MSDPVGLIIGGAIGMLLFPGLAVAYYKFSDWRMDRAHKRERRQLELFNRHLTTTKGSKTK